LKITIVIYNLNYIPEFLKKSNPVFVGNTLKKARGEQVTQRLLAQLRLQNAVILCS